MRLTSLRKRQVEELHQEKFTFHSVHVSSGRKRGKVGCKYEASLSATGNRRPTSNIFTRDLWRSERPSQRHKPSPEHDLLGMSSAKRKLIMCIQKSHPPQVNSNGKHETTTRTSSGRCKLRYINCRDAN